MSWCARIHVQLNSHICESNRSFEIQRTRGMPADEVQAVWSHPDAIPCTDMQGTATKTRLFAVFCACLRLRPVSLTTVLHRAYDTRVRGGLL